LKPNFNLVKLRNSKQSPPTRLRNHKMNLTRNEKRALKLLLENAKISDSTIASILKISSQAVGKIRRKLEKTVIDSYTINLNYQKIGIHTFAMGTAKLTQEGQDKGTLEIEQKLLDDPHILQVCRLPKGNTKYAILYGFRDMNELDFFFHSPHKKKDMHNYLELEEINTFSHNSLIKNSPINLFFKMIDNLGTDTAKHGFREIEKKRNRVNY
jgi:DNA-binding Lrp family transcriptional regulator